METKILRWGIFGCGKISTDFCIALSSLSNHKIEHVAARDINKAKTFATTFKVEKYSDNYEKVATDPNVDVVYIGTINPTHKPLSLLAMNNGKAVLCEKPVAMNSKELEESLECARKNKVFFMEAIWTRCFPLYHDVLSKLKDSTAGEANVLFATFGVESLFDVERVCNIDLGGSVLLDIGIYTLTVADMIFNGLAVKEIKACGHMDEATALDRSVSITLLFENNKIAQLLADGDHNLPNTCTIMTSNGRIDTASPFWCPESYTQQVDSTTTVNKFDLPVGSMKTFFMNSMGLSYEADHVRDCIISGKLESELVSHKTSQRIMGYLDEIRKQIGLKFPQD